MSRSNSLDSIPDVDFITKSLDNDELEIANLNSKVPVVSAFRMKEIQNLLADEPLLLSDKSRFVLFPIKYSDVSII